MEKQNKRVNTWFTTTVYKAFTLVELIVVITILAILGTIAFISLQGYSRDARDSTRTADLGNIKTSLELFSLKTGQYPSPDSFSTITYSGGTENVWFQGVVGDIVTTNLKSLNEKPLDPLTSVPYTYSVTNSYKEYEILALYEGGVAYTPIINQTNAAVSSLTPKIVGNYNGVFVKTTNYIIATPSIVTAEPLTGGILILNSTNINSQVMTNGTNIPKNSLTLAQTGALNINLSVYTGSITKSSGTGAMITAVQQIQGAYTGTTIATNENIAYILNQTTNDQLIALGNITILKGGSPLVVNNIVTSLDKRSVLNCGITSGEIIYGTITGGSGSLTCSDNIIVCNGTTGSGYTISACNVGATEVTLSDNSNKTTSYGGLYQWGNNYDSRGNQFTNSAIYPITVTQILTVQNYTTYTSNAYVQGAADWTNQDPNGPLRSAQWNVCPTGYHIPTQPEWNSIFTPALLGTTQTAYGITNQLKIPTSGSRDWLDSSTYNQSIRGYYWSSSPYSTQVGYNMYFNSTTLAPSSGLFRAVGASVRCFKN